MTKNVYYVELIGDTHAHRIVCFDKDMMNEAIKKAGGLEKIAFIYNNEQDVVYDYSKDEQ